MGSFSMLSRYYLLDRVRLRVNLLWGSLSCGSSYSPLWVSFRGWGPAGLRIAIVFRFYPIALVDSLESARVTRWWRLFFRVSGCQVAFFLLLIGMIQPVCVCGVAGNLSTPSPCDVSDL